MIVPNQPVETACHRECFYVGGTYTENKSDLGGETRTGQIYVERLTPIGGAKRPYPIIFVHGGGQNGTNWLNTPDGRKGWASYFLDQGYTVYIPDTASRGRSAYMLGEKHFQYPVKFVEDYFTATSGAMLWPQAKLHTQWPGSGRRGDPIFDAFYASTSPSLFDLEKEQLLNQAAGAALLRHIGQPSILITHSQGAPTGWLMADACPELVKAIVAVEPNGPPFSGKHPHNGQPARLWGITDAPMAYSPPIYDHREFKTIAKSDDGSLTPAVLQDAAGIVHKWVNLKDIPVLVEMGEASYHAPYDHCTVAFLKQVGIQVDFMKLEDSGIRGNGHMQMLELNNLEIAEILDEWIRKTVE